jgi:hypothetical protein
MNISARDKIALSAALIGGPVFGFLATEFGGSGHQGVRIAIPFVFLFIPTIVMLTERLEFWVWQASVVSFAIYVLAWNIRLHKISFARGGGGLSFPRIVFVLWGVGTALSAPVPLYFCLRRIARPYRYYIAFGLTIGAILFYWMLKITFE